MGSKLNLYDDLGAPVEFSGEDAKGLAGGVSAKAWINFNGTGTVAIRDSYNVSSITDNAVGVYTVNFTTAMVDNDYAVSPGCVRGTGGDGVGAGAYMTITSETLMTASGFQMYHQAPAWSNPDSIVVTAIIFR